MGLLCHCDHCQNSTCTTRENGQCYGQLSLDENGEIDRKLNCFNQDSRSLLVNLICEDSISKTSQTIFRCCKSDNYCNLKDNFLPSDAEAKKILLEQRKLLSPLNMNNPSLRLNSTPNYNIRNRINGLNDPVLSGLKNITHAPVLERYSNIPMELKLIFIIISGLLLIIALALGQNCLSIRRRRVRQRIASGGQHPDGSQCSHQSLNPTNNVPNANGPPNEDHSENSSGQVFSEAAIYDTNSMASREPLIQNAANCCKGVHASSLSHPHPMRGPYMDRAEDSANNKTMSNFQMSIGSGDPQGQNKPETSSGSGSGQPYLTQRSIAHDIELSEVVGRGYFGVVWRGEYKGEPVAVKIFSAMAEPSWAREAEIYQTTLLRHKNILGFIATDKRDDIGVTGYWLVTDYYPMGSLYDFLKRNSMSMSDAIRMSFSIANGLSHLHVEIFGTRAKPAIAHRDLKSKNILVKNDGTCCIADLGMAVRYNSNTGIVDVPSNTRVGTRRYLAPEVLENKLNLMDFEAVKATDVYSLGLVLWEVLRRTCYIPQPGQEIEDAEEIAGICEPYEAPYQDVVSIDPSTDEMYHVVCVEKVRPAQSQRWSKYPPMNEYSVLMRECWYEKPQARLSALRVRKTLGDMARHYFNINMEYD